MTTQPERSAAEAFFLYAETHFPSDAKREATLGVLQRCADSTAKVAPSVATYVFRRSSLAGVVGERLFPGSVSSESTELYLTNKGFRDHIAPSEFRDAVREMYVDIGRLGARIFWIGAKPPSDMLHNIFRSDPLARPVATLHEKLFDDQVYKTSRNEDVIIVSILRPVGTGEGAIVSDIIEAAAATLRSISIIAFFHPFAQELLRFFVILPIDGAQSAEQVVEALKPLLDGGERPSQVRVLCQVPRSRDDLVSKFEESTRGSNASWEVTRDGYSGYISHPSVPTDDGPEANGLS